MHVFGLQEEAGEPEEIPENTQTVHRKGLRFPQTNPVSAQSPVGEVVVTSFIVLHCIQVVSVHAIHCGSFLMQFDHLRVR